MAKNRSSLLNETMNSLTNAEEETLLEETSFNEELSRESNNFLSEELLSHSKIKTNFVGTITELGKSTSKVVLQTTNDMVVDEFGLIHSGFIFGAAEYAAIAAVNQANIVIIGCRSKFFAPAKVGNIVEFEAKGRYDEARKREVKVIGKINEIKVFEGIFQAVLLENHVLKTKIEELQATFGMKE